ncbi:phosphoadenosine phosphosulfate reductase domain-containing protein [Hymenobacter cellulosivorans]|uniref:Phosphoadenosine phosphosulfate reductase family protein n=1 Tax=Hymenobacter cellulosivorans TaxID=2932249 RepID=A0ABY4FAF7_9BACT|nr:phosphoadenosine phosphosulfate reductase family protein [Hymenobacter cellulosivorans]UOQ53082.1 phosphoadenosine phosphosulfate reductase family protein [Hymenobacter cellulosivorans]
MEDTSKSFGPAFEVPAVILAALQAGADMVWSLSGGKDSQALVIVGAAWFRLMGFPGRQYIVHADLGRAEWPQTAAFVEKLAQQVGLPLVIVQRKKGDLVARFEERIEATRATGAPFWPSAESRYCTSHLKGGPIDQVLRNPAPFWPSSDSRYCTSDLKRGPIDGALRSAEVVISAEGVRADESRERAKKPVVEIRASITAKSTVKPEENLASMSPEDALAARNPGKRVALNWRPLLNWSTEDIWRACGTSSAELEKRQALYRNGHHHLALDGWVGHPAYVFGNQRLSCAFCVLGSKSDLLNGAQHNPELYAHLIQLEIIGDATFKNNWSLAELPVTGRAAQLRDEVLAGKEQANG